MIRRLPYISNRGRHSVATGPTSDETVGRAEAAAQRCLTEMNAAFAAAGDGLPFDELLCIPPFAEGSLPGDADQRVRFLSLAVRKFACHPFVAWNLDYTSTGWSDAAALAGLIVGYGNKCGPIAHITQQLLTRYGLCTRIVHACGRGPNGVEAAHTYNEVEIDGRWRLLDNDILAGSHSFFTNADGGLMTRAEILASDVDALADAHPYPYTFPGFAYDRAWVRRQWEAWRSAVSGRATIEA